jgi:predicted phage terminase large subunit-like protein
VVDDPIKPWDALNPTVKTSLDALTKVTEWWQHTMSTRMADPINGRRVIIMQRLHENDLAGEMLKDGGYEHLRIPMRYEADNPCKWDPRRTEGELANPKRFPEETVKRIEKELGSEDNVNAQLQQRPSSASGNIFKAEWFQRYDELPKGFGYYIQVWDLTFKKEGTSRVCGDLWARFGNRLYLVDRVCRRMGFNETLKEIEDRAKDPIWKRAHACLIEEKANGPAIIETLIARSKSNDPKIRSQVKNVIGLNGTNMPSTASSKIERASSAAPSYEAKNVWHPNQPWVAEGETNLKNFPKARDDDEVDTTSYAILWFQDHAGGLGEAMAGMNAKR